MNGEQVKGERLKSYSAGEGTGRRQTPNEIIPNNSSCKSKLNKSESILTRPHPCEQGVRVETRVCHNLSPAKFLGRFGREILEEGYVRKARGRLLLCRQSNENTCAKRVLGVSVRL